MFRRAAVSVAKVASRAMSVSVRAPTVQLRQVTPVAFSVRRFATESHDHHDHHAVNDGEPFLDVKEVTERILEVVKNFEKVNKSKVTPTSHFKNDLELDSLDTVEVVMAIEEEFNIEIPDSEADKILTIEDAVKFVANHPMSK